MLEFMKDKLGNDEGPLDESSLANVRHPPVYDHARVQNLWILSDKGGFGTPLKGGEAKLLSLFQPYC